MINSFRLTLFFLIAPLFCLGQIKGIVVDENNDPLPYVNIHLKNSSIGTTTNFEGNFLLKAPTGLHTVVFQYVGYKTVEKEVAVSAEILELEIQLQPETYETTTIKISANAEDPAYAIIRKAQARRKEYLARMKNYTCDAYVKGFTKVNDAPRKILGQEVGDLDGALDSTRQGVVYLSESVSKLYVKEGKSKEVLYSSKVSGNDQGYSFNSAQEMEFNFYEKTLDLNRKIISPIAPSAMSYYKYQLEGIHYEADGQLVNRIKVIPKNNFSPAFYGYIFINEDLWNIHSLELGVTAKATQIPFIDSLTFKQIFIPLEEDRWMPLSNVIRFKMGAFGFKFGGNFACVYSNYELDNTDDNIFNNEVFKVEKEANTRSQLYWDSLRPIPLTLEEKVDYKRKDSIRIVRESPEYLDSIDRKNNKLKWSSIIFGHSFQNSIKRTRLAYKSPLQLEANTIQGWTTDFGLEFTKAYDKERNRYLTIKGDMNYGFSEKVWRPRFEIGYRADRINHLKLNIKGGRELTQYNRNNPISPSLNSLMTLSFRRNYLKAYDRKFLDVSVSRYLSNILFGRIGMEYSDRSAVTNNYDGGWGYKDSREFTSNNPLDPASDELAFSNQKAVIFRAALRIRFGAQVWNYPNQKFRGPTKWPNIWLFYKRAIPIHGDSPDYDLISASISNTYDAGTLGYFSFNTSAGKFLRAENISFIDHYHFLGNQTHVGNPFRYRNSFLLLPYYSHSTDDSFVQLHLQHNFNGFLLSKVPAIKYLGWHLVGGFKHLNTSEQGPYFESHLGIDNIGIHIFRPLRVDFVWSHQSSGDCDGCNSSSRFGVVLGVKAGF